MREFDNNWKRLESVIAWANMTTNCFAKQIGLARAETLYQIKRGHYGISRGLAARIVNRFPEIDKLWLLTGEGQMFKGDCCADGSTECRAGKTAPDAAGTAGTDWADWAAGAAGAAEQQQTPYYDGGIGVCRAIADGENPQPAGRIVLPGQTECDFALRCTDGDMEPELPEGCIMLLKKQTTADYCGRAYVIVGRKIVTLRYVSGPDADGRLTLTDGNGKNETTQCNDIAAAYRVAATIIIKKS